MTEGRFTVAALDRGKLPPVAGPARLAVVFACGLPVHNCPSCPQGGDKLVHKRGSGGQPGHCDLREHRPRAVGGESFADVQQVNRSRHLAPDEWAARPESFCRRRPVCVTRPPWGSSAGHQEPPPPPPPPPTEPPVPRRTTTCCSTSPRRMTRTHCRRSANSLPSTWASPCRVLRLLQHRLEPAHPYLRQPEHHRIPGASPCRFSVPCAMCSAPRSPDRSASPSGPDCSFLRMSSSAGRTPAGGVNCTDVTPALPPITTDSSCPGAGRRPGICPAKTRSRPFGASAPRPPR